MQVRNSDAAGNNSTTTNNTSSITIDTTAPSQPSINPISTPTNDTTSTITGTGVNGDTITLFQGATSIGTATVASGVWSITPSALINACNLCNYRNRN